jgi:ubiquinone/menaquinone biosynthesis C-methylase UbiE
MGFYKVQIVPLLINLTMRRRYLAAYRSRVVPAADGRVLEIGIGSGLNLPFYSRNVKHLIGLDPSPKLLSMVRRNLRPGTPSVELIEGSAEAIPLENNSVDTVVTTWTLCSIPDAALAVREMRRVLRPKAESALVAGPFNSGLETYRRWLSSQPTDPGADRRWRFPI